MNILKKYYKLIIFSLIFFLILIIPINLKNNNSLLNVKEFLKTNLSPEIFIFFQVFGDPVRTSKKNNNDYNIHFLPKTQLLEIDLKKIDLMKNFKKTDRVGYAKHLVQKVKQRFFLGQYNDNIFILNSIGELFYVNYVDLEIGKLNKIKTNINFKTTFDLFIHNETVYISGEISVKDCSKLQVIKSKITNLDEINFEIIFETDECVRGNASGKIQKLYQSKKNSILLTTAGDVMYHNGHDPKPQNDASIYGKILEIDINTKKVSQYSKGHRNILGFYSDEKVILATEMGPRGGDEINKIELGQNYGWPIASYGTKYDYLLSNNFLDYESSHENFDFKEPIFNFFSSVGISEIIKINDSFSDKWKGSFLVASLNGKHLYRIKFDKNFNKILYVENIFINERIRDLIYFKEKNLILLALETSGSLGIFKPIK